MLGGVGRGGGMLGGASPGGNGFCGGATACSGACWGATACRSSCGVLGCSDLQAVGYLQVMTGEWAGISLGILRSDWSVLSLKGSRGSERTLKGYERTLRGCETTLLRGFVCVSTAWTRGRVITRPSYYRLTRVEHQPQHSRHWL